MDIFRHNLNNNLSRKVPVRKKRRFWPYTLFALFAGFAFLAFLGYRFIKNITPEQILRNIFIQDQIVRYLGEDKREIVKLLPEFLGFDEPKTYLLLFLNNTELRPGGGFIGTYSIVRIDNGDPEILITEGTEALDKRAPSDWKIIAPKPITDYLGVDRWYFRDSNWSPDFEENAQKALEFYKAEGGLVADQIDVVVGITPTVLEELMKLSGPVTVDNIKFTSEDVIEKLEYEVEYGFAQRNIHFKDRKQIMEPFFTELLGRITDNFGTHFNSYMETLQELTDRKHILVYAVDDNINKAIEKLEWTGKVVDVEGDYLMWVDANLGALKTDHAMKRGLKYKIEKILAEHEGEDDYYIATATMVYKHTGKFDWRTTRYRSYARIFVPNESELISVSGSMKTDKSNEPSAIYKGIENGKQWFGVFISIEPGQTKELSFTYKLPADIKEQIDKGLYTLFVQKQAGTIGHDLTLDLNFGKTIKGAEPDEKEENFGDDKYSFDTDLSVNREFVIKF